MPLYISQKQGKVKRTRKILCIFTKQCNADEIKQHFIGVIPLPPFQLLIASIPAILHPFLRLCTHYISVLYLHHIHKQKKGFLPFFSHFRDKTNFYRSCRAVRTARPIAAAVCRKCSFVCTAETNIASNCEGATYSPASSMAEK